MGICGASEFDGADSEDQASDGEPTGGECKKTLGVQLKKARETPISHDALIQELSPDYANHLAALEKAKEIERLSEGGNKAIPRMTLNRTKSVHVERSEDVEVQTLYSFYSLG